MLGHFVKKYIYTIDPDHTWLTLAFKATLAGSLALLCVLYFSLNQSIFLVLSASLFILHNPHDSRPQQLINILFAGLLGALGVFLTSIVNQHLVWLLMVLFIFSTIAIYIGVFGNHFALAGLLALTVIIVAAGLPCDSHQAIYRFFLAILGLIIALGVNYLIFPKNPIKKLQKTLNIYLSEIANYFYHTTSDCLRGNHLLTRHWQLKEKLWDLTNKINLLVKELSKDHNDSNNKYLINLSEHHKKLTISLFALSNLLTNPANNAMFAQVISSLSEFCYVTHQLLQKLSAIKQKNEIVELQPFKITVAKLQERLQQIWQAELSKSTVYHWPFDLINLSYILTEFQQALIILHQYISYQDY